MSTGRVSFTICTIFSAICCATQKVTTTGTSRTGIPATIAATRNTPHTIAKRIGFGTSLHRSLPPSSRSKVVTGPSMARTYDITPGSRMKGSHCEQDDHDPTSSPSCLTRSVTRSCSTPCIYGHSRGRAVRCNYPRGVSYRKDAKVSRNRERVPRSVTGGAVPRMDSRGGTHGIQPSTRPSPPPPPPPPPPRGGGGEANAE